VAGQGHAGHDKPLGRQPFREGIHRHRRKVEAVNQDDTTAHRPGRAGARTENPAEKPGHH
jgi:hypothetical protein